MRCHNIYKITCSIIKPLNK